jgi:hypothetical protein
MYASLKHLTMKKIILIGATLLIATSAIVVANTNSNISDCENCPMGVCKPDQCKEKCTNAEECCKQ